MMDLGEMILFSLNVDGPKTARSIAASIIGGPSVRVIRRELAKLDEAGKIKRTGRCGTAYLWEAV